MVPYGAADEARTRYLHLGKVALYQMSYSRIFKQVAFLLFYLSVLTERYDFQNECPDTHFENGASGRNRTTDTGIFSPLLYRLSYRGILATRMGLEPTASSVTG